MNIKIILNKGSNKIIWKLKIILNDASYNINNSKNTSK